MIRRLGMSLEWHEVWGGTKKGLYVLGQAVKLINGKQEEIIDEVNRLRKELDELRLATPPNNLKD